MQRLREGSRLCTGPEDVASWDRVASSVLVSLSPLCLCCGLPRRRSEPLAGFLVAFSDIEPLLLRGSLILFVCVHVTQGLSV